jgi:chaperonin GroES
MKIKPLFDKVVLKRAEKELKTKSGIILSESAAEKPDFLEVVAVGEGAYVDGELQPMKVKKGDKVLMAKYSGSQVKIDGEEYTIVSQNEILAIVE